MRKYKKLHKELLERVKALEAQLNEDTYETKEWDWPHYTTVTKPTIKGSLETVIKANNLFVEAHPKSCVPPKVTAKATGDRKQKRVRANTKPLSKLAKSKKVK